MIYLSTDAVVMKGLRASNPPSRQPATQVFPASQDKKPPRPSALIWEKNYNPRSFLGAEPVSGNLWSVTWLTVHHAASSPYVR
ncbi:hypothetical protein E2C01_017388 [Portunus trituberculatus]|uniref:Uncharacterized protein n=1 Tax=Portunus trituberculatus TaxID=210409 RepID=A0A5B7DTA3_PORTR|nr:hypothetical protein [Portunus trituberculatus]